jgi:hypothetical protein
MFDPFLASVENLADMLLLVREEITVTGDVEHGQMFRLVRGLEG